MIKPQKSKIHAFLLNFFLDGKFKKRFSFVNFQIDRKINAEKSLLIIGNHTTWWDGFIVWQLNRQLLHKSFYLMMLEEQLNKLWFFKKIGCFSINPGSRTVVESLRFGAELLKQKSTMLAFYPQGRLFSLYNEEFTFNKGIGFLLKNNVHTELLLYCLFVDYASNEKPYMNVYLKILANPQNLSYLDIEAAYKLFYSESKAQHVLSFKQ